MNEQDFDQIFNNTPQNAEQAFEEAFGYELTNEDQVLLVEITRMMGSRRIRHRIESLREYVTRPVMTTILQVLSGTEVSNLRPETPQEPDSTPEPQHAMTDDEIFDEISTRSHEQDNHEQLNDNIEDVELVEEERIAESDVSNDLPGESVDLSQINYMPTLPRSFNDDTQFIKNIFYDNWDLIHGILADNAKMDINFRTKSIHLHYPRSVIRNTDGSATHVIYDLICKIKILSGVLSFSATRFSQSTEEANANYFHSHINEGNQMGIFRTICGGNSTLSRLIGTNASRFENEDNLIELISNINTFVHTESTSGGPYHRISSFSEQSNNINSLLSQANVSRISSIPLTDETRMIISAFEEENIEMPISKENGKYIFNDNDYSFIDKLKEKCNYVVIGNCDYIKSEAFEALREIRDRQNNSETSEAEFQVISESETDFIFRNQRMMAKRIQVNRQQQISIPEISMDSFDIPVVIVNRIKNRIEQFLETFNNYLIYEKFREKFTREVLLNKKVTNYRIIDSWRPNDNIQESLPTDIADVSIST